MKHHIFRDFIRESFLPPRQMEDPAARPAGKPRIAFVDLAKGICILLVLLNHFDKEIFGFPNFSALRMPLYFTLSGLFFHAGRDTTLFTVKKVNNILVPFLFWVVLGYVLLFLYNWFEWHEIYPPEKLVDGLTTRIIRPNYPVWFLLCLFITNLLFCLLSTFLSGAALFAGVLALAVAGCAADACGVYLAMWLDTACTAMPFFYMGYLLKKSPLLRSEYRWYRTLPAGCLCIGAAYLLYYLFDKPGCDLCINEIQGNTLVFYLDSCLFVLGVLLVCKAVRWLPVVSCWGRYSIVILCVQAIFFSHVHHLVYTLSGYRLSPAEYRTLVFFLCWLSIPFCRRFLPWFIAQKPLIKYPGRPSRMPSADPA